MGTQSKWWTAHDESVVLDGLTLRLQLGPAGTRDLVCANGKPPDTQDVDRATKEIVTYFNGRVSGHHT